MGTPFWLFLNKRFDFFFLACLFKDMFYNIKIDWPYVSSRGDFLLGGINDWDGALWQPLPFLFPPHPWYVEVPGSGHLLWTAFTSLGFLFMRY